MHGRYLGGREEEIREKYYYNVEEVDSAQIDVEIIKAHNEIFNNPSKFCTLYLDTLARPQFFYDSLRFEQDLEFKALISKYTDDPRAAIDSLNALQRYSPDDFALCTAKIDKIENWKSDSTWSFGRLRLSRVVLNDSEDKGLIFYDWHCGSMGLCGHSGIIEFIKGTRKWEIAGFKYWSVY
jgi:hypothetical protein